MIKHSEFKQQRAKTDIKSVNKFRDKWDSAKPADSEHPYLVDKHIGPEHFRQVANKLVIPLKQGKVFKGQQYIENDGKKKFATGSKVSGSYYLIKGISDCPLLIAEGIATGISLNRATSFTTMVSFTSTNLKHIAKSMRKKFPDREIRFFAKMRT